MPTLSTVIRAALDLVLPLSCAGCGRHGGVLCDSCRADLPTLTAPYCARCADPGRPLCAACEAEPPAYGAITAPFLMEGVVRDLVYSLKGFNLVSVPFATPPAGYDSRSLATAIGPISTVLRWDGGFTAWLSDFPDAPAGIFPIEPDRGYFLRATETVAGFLP